MSIFFWVKSFFIDAFWSVLCISDFSHAESYLVLFFMYKYISDITGSVDMSLSKPQEIVKYRQALSAAAHGVTKNQTWLSNEQQCIHMYISPLLDKDWKTKTGREHWKCAIYPEITCIERWFHCNPSWLNLSNLLFSAAEWMFYSFSLGSVSVCMQSSGGLLYWREEHNILQVCLALWHLNKLERCTNLAKDRGQSDGWTGIISHFSCCVFIAINFKQGNRLHGVCCIRKEVCILLWLISILV